MYRASVRADTPSRSQITALGTPSHSMSLAASALCLCPMSDTRLPRTRTIPSARRLSHTAQGDRPRTAAMRVSDRPARSIATSSVSRVIDTAPTPT